MRTAAFISSSAMYAHALHARLPLALMPAMPAMPSFVCCLPACLPCLLPFVHPHVLACLRLLLVLLPAYYLCHLAYAYVHALHAYL